LTTLAATELAKLRSTLRRALTVDAGYKNLFSRVSFLKQAIERIRNCRIERACRNHRLLFLSANLLGAFSFNDTSASELTPSV
jgi:hypothetical protein